MNALFSLIVILAIYGLFIIIASVLEHFFRKRKSIPDEKCLKMIVAVKDAEEHIEGVANEIIRNWWNTFPLKEGMLYFCDCGSTDDTYKILERLEESQPFIRVVYSTNHKDDLAENIAEILEFNDEQT